MEGAHGRYSRGARRLQTPGADATRLAGVVAMFVSARSRRAGARRRAAGAYNLRCRDFLPRSPMTRREFLAAAAATAAAARAPVEGHPRHAADHRHPPAPVGSGAVQTLLAQARGRGHHDPGAQLHARRIRRGHRRPQRRQVRVHGSGRGPRAAADRGRLRNRAVQGREDLDGRRRGVRPAQLRRLRRLRRPVQGQPVREGPPPGASRRVHAARLRPRPEVRPRHPTARRPRAELRPVRAAGRAARLLPAPRPVPEHPLHPRPLRQRRPEAHAGPARAVEEGHGRDRRRGRTSSAR